MSTRKVLTVAAVLGLLILGSRYLLPVFLPFLLAAGLALAAEPLVSFFCRKTRLPRSAATGIGVTMTLMLLILLIMTLVALLLRELGALAGVLPSLEDTAVRGMSLLEQWLLGLVSRAPGSMGSVLSNSVEGLFSDSTALLDQITSRLPGLASGILKGIPDSALGLFTWLLASFMLSARLPRIKAWIQTKLPPAWHEKTLPMLHRLKISLLGWLKAQLKLIGITFLVLTIGFFILQISYAPLWALVIALVDALPVLGTGMVLVPWSLVCFLQEDTARGIGLLGIYATAALLRSVLEPKLVGKQLGLDPLVTLAAMYAGFRLFGFGGMIISPLLTVILIQFVTISRNS